ncbi:VanW family protein [Bacillus spongiae]|uniref:VanW family protein n=1 Tax=Bacillus spongiae TaxID=2683610 RepID=A0ABU8HB12_9BACI
MKLFFTFILLTIITGDASNNLTLQLDGKTLDTIHHSKFTHRFLDETMIDEAALETYMLELEKKVYKPPKNAYIGDDDEIVKETTGRKLDKTKFIDHFYTYYFSKKPSQITIPVKYIYPTIDSELLISIRSKFISQYVTFFNSRNKERSHNIQLAAKAIDNTVIFPGEKFSFNKVVGKRTKKKGYLSAPVIVRGELSEGIGGGICQVSSTLFNAVDRAGVKIVERYSHSRKVPYVPPNRDATVSWYGPDFTFKNPHNQPILIRAKVYGGQLIIKVFSSNELKSQLREVPSAPKALPKEVHSNEGHPHQLNAEERGN